MSIPSTVKLIIFSDGEVIEESNSMRYSSIRPSANLRIDRKIKFGNLVRKLYDRTKIDLNQFLLKVFIKYSSGEGGTIRENLMEIKDDEDLWFFLDPVNEVSTLELFIEKQMIQSQDPFSSLLTQVTPMPNQFPSFYSQPFLPDLNIGISQIADTQAGCSTSGNAYDGVGIAHNENWATNSTWAFPFHDMHAGGPSEHFEEANYNANFSNHAGASSSAEPHFDQFEDDENVQSADSDYYPSDSDMDEEMNYIPTDTDDDEEKIEEEDVPPAVAQERLHRVLPFYSTKDPEVEGDSLGLLNGVQTRDMIYDYRIGNLGLGLVFENKKSLQKAVKDYHCKHQKREYKVTISEPNKWKVVCKHKNKPEHCEFELRAHFNVKLNMWIISKFGKLHSCLFDNTREKHPNLDMNLIANELIPHVEENPAFEINQIIVLVQQKWNCQISYGKAWYSLQRANELVYGTWEDSVKNLPKLLGAIKKWNPGTIVEWVHKDAYENPKVLKYVFWAFRPCIDGFQHCRRVICVDGTHLYARYNGKLLIATTLDGNNNILPLAFAIVDNETNESWLWFLRCMSHYFVSPNEGVCLLSDRHQGLLNGVKVVRAFHPPLGCHRYCLRHVVSNFNHTFKNKALKQLCSNAGNAHSIEKFEREMNKIRALNEEAGAWLDKIDKEKWTLSHDGGVREGIMTTNMGESFNNVMKTARHLPPTAIVEFTFHKLATYFCDRAVDGLKMKSNGPLTRQATKLYEKETDASSNHEVRKFSYSNQTGQVFCRAQFESRGRRYSVDLKNQNCSCGNWTAIGIPCSHAVALAKALTLRSINLVKQYYGVDEYIKIYEGRFYPLPDKYYWDTPNFELIHDPYSRKKRLVGRNVSTRIQNEMDS